MPLDAVVTGFVAAGLVSAVIVAAVGRAPREGLRVLLDFLLAAGLLRLLGPQSWTTLAVAALIIVIRQVAGHGITVPERLRRERTVAGTQHTRTT